MAKLDFFPDIAFGWTFFAVLVSFLTAASIVDFRSLRIPKALSISCLVAGVVFNLSRGMWLGLQDKAVWTLSSGPVLGTLDGLIFSLAGFAASFAIFFALWFLQVAGGGDVKLFAAVGAWVGPWLIVLLMIGSVFMVVLITLGMIVTSMVTAGFAETHKSFSGQGSRRAIESGRREEARADFLIPAGVRDGGDLALRLVPRFGTDRPLGQCGVIAALQPGSVADEVGRASRPVGMGRDRSETLPVMRTKRFGRDRTFQGGVGAMGNRTAIARRALTPRQGAIMAMELLLIFPLMMAIFFGTVEYGLLLAAEARLFNASREGARVAAAGGNLDDVKAAVKAALLKGEQNLVDIKAVLTDPPNSTQPVPPGSPVAVQVSASAKTLVPDFLRFIGFSIANRCLSGQTVMRKE